MAKIGRTLSPMVTCVGRDGKNKIRNGVRHDDTTMKTPKHGRAQALRISAWGCKNMVEAW